MLIFLKEHKTAIIIGCFAYLYVLFVAIAPTNYNVTAPGGLTQIESSFVIEDHEMPDQFFSIYVYSYDPITSFQYMVLQNNDQFILRKPTIREQENTIIDEYRQGQISKSVSYQIALIKAYTMAQEQDDTIVMDYGFEGLYIYDFPKRLEEVSIGDIVKEINGESYADYEPNAFFNLSSHQQATYLIEKADGTEYELIYNQIAGDVSFWFYPKYEIYEANPTYELPGLNSTVGGPSGGMLQTLSIYVSLLKLNIPDIKISGTGTINTDGIIGRIGGIRQKIYTAEFNKVDVFFIPASHLSEIEGIDYSFIIVPVETIEEAANWLYEEYNG
jgi:PDZ domain-containing protein